MSFIVGRVLTTLTPLQDFVFMQYLLLKQKSGGSDSKESAYNVGALDLIPGLGRSPEGGHAIPKTA